MRAVSLASAAAGALAALALLACASDEERLEEHLARADAHLEEEELELAWIELGRALAIAPRSPEINFRLAQLARGQANLSDALYFYRETHRLDPSRVDARMEEAALLLGSDPERAAELVEEALESHPDRPVVHRRHAELALVEGDTERASTAARTAVELAPDHSANHHTLGIVYQARIRERRLRGLEVPDSLYREAIEAFDRAGNESSLLEKARVYAVWPGHEAEAQGVFRELAQRLRERELWDGLARAASLAWRHSQSTDDLAYRRWALEQILLADGSRIPAWESLAALAQRTGGSAEEVMHRMLQTRPEDIDAHLAYSNFLVRTGALEAGLEHLIETADRGIEPATALSGLLARQIELGRLDRARSTLERMRREHPRHPMTRLSEARLAMRERRYADAARELRGHLDAEESSEAWGMLAIARLRLGDLSRASAAIDRSLELAGTPTPRLLRAKAAIAGASRDWLSVVETLDRLRRTAGGLTPDEEVQLSRALYGLDRPRPARAILNNLFKDEKVAPAAAALLFARREGESFERRAYRQLKLAHEREPGNPLLLQELVRLEQERGRPGRALELLEAAIAKGPVTPLLLHMRARALLRMGELERAERDAMRAFEARPDLPGGTELLVAIYSERDRTEEAIRSFEDARKAGVLPVEGSVLLARLHLHAGRQEQARRIYEQVLAREQLPAVMNDLAYILADQDRDLERALRLAREARRRMSGTPSVADTLGFVHYRLGAHPAAIEQFRHAIELAEEAGTPKPEYYYHLGLALRATGDGESAIEAFETALALDPDSARAEVLEGELGSTRASLEARAGSS